MTAGDGSKKSKTNGIEPDGVPWYIRAEDTADLVYREDPAIRVFPDRDVDVAPLAACKIKAGKRPAVFRMRPITNREHLGLASLSIQGLKEDTLHEKYLAAAFEIAQMCVVEVQNPDGTTLNNDQWREAINQCHPGLVVGLGLWVLSESTWNPAESKKKQRSRRTSGRSGKSTA